MPEWLGGVISHTAGSTPNGSWIVVDVWEAQEAFDRFPASCPWPAFDPVAVIDFLPALKDGDSWWCRSREDSS
jgi:hypothetical protein